MEKQVEIPLDLLMLLGLHAIWRSRMAVRHADVDARPVRMYFIESICRLKSVYATLVCAPDWVSILDVLETLKEF